MTHPACNTRFAPSPSGGLHLGNARTAFFSYLAARAAGGRFVLRSEDTDAARSTEPLLQGQLEDLRWFGLEWDEGPDVGGPHGPYRQSERSAVYRDAIAQLRERGHVYPCFCSPEQLQLSRRAQLAAGRPPRYARTCAGMTPAEVAHRVAAGQQPALRFRVPDGQVVEFVDHVHGPQRFATDDIGDFVISRADGSAAFFLGNAVDDATMAVTLVMRGDDHLANTPRQILLLRALDLPVPEYAHLPLLLSPAGSPLSKREGAVSLRDLRVQGYLSAALRNYLLRLGHACGEDGWLGSSAMPAHFHLQKISRSAARFDEAQLLHWQREAIARATLDELDAWLSPRLAALEPGARRAAFIAAVRGNLLFPADVEPWLQAVTSASLSLDADATGAVTAAGAGFFRNALATWQTNADDFKAWTRALATATACKGAALYMPLRAALTGATHGPELAPLVSLMGSERVQQRLQAGERIADDRGISSRSQ
jgi:glutamyl-tRNA synthetase